MPGKYLHEELYRGGTDRLAKPGELKLVLCGAGAVGSHLADNLARQGFSSLRVIDRDRAEEHNVGSQLYGESDVGVWKVEALRNRIFRAAGVEIEAVRKELTAQTAPALLKVPASWLTRWTTRRRANWCRTTAARPAWRACTSGYSRIIAR